MAKKSYVWKDPTTVSKITVIGLSIAAFIHVGSIAVWLIFQNYAGYDPSQTDLTLAQDWRAIFDLGLFVAYLSCSPIIFWIYSVCRNAHTLSRKMTISPGWAIGWYLVPVASLFQPYESMKEIWSASSGLPEKDNPPLIKQWWLSFLGSNLLVMVSRVGSLDKNWIFGAIVSVISLYVIAQLISIVRQVCAMQINRNGMKDVFGEPDVEVRFAGFS